jgi:hypothetical protein
LRDVRDELLVDRAVTNERGRSESETTTAAVKGNEARTALLDDNAVGSWCPALFKPRVTGP